VSSVPGGTEGRIAGGVMELVSAEMAQKIAEKGFPEGGYRACRHCNKSHRVPLENIVRWTKEGIPRCRLCGNRTELLTPEENARSYLS
jgi:hypothetical protein